MLQNSCKPLGFKKNMVYKIPLGGGGGGKPYPASGLHVLTRNSRRRLILYSEFHISNTFKNELIIEAVEDLEGVQGVHSNPLSVSRFKIFYENEIIWSHFHGIFTMKMK